MRTAQNQDFTTTVGEGKYLEKWVFSVDGQAGGPFPHIIVKQYDELADEHTVPRVTTLRFNGKAFVPDDAEMMEDMPIMVQYSYTGFSVGVVEGAFCGYKADEAGETITQQNCHADRQRQDWQATNNYLTLQSPQGVWEVQGQKTTQEPTQLSALLVAPSGLEVRATMDAKGNVEYTADTKAHSFSLPKHVGVAAQAFLIGQVYGLYHARDNQREQGQAPEKAQADAAVISQVERLQESRRRAKQQDKGRVA